VNEDASGLTFEEWDPSTDTGASEAPVTMIECFTTTTVEKLIENRERSS
jgi:hypothetical protein